MKPISRQEFEKMMAQGRSFCWAGLYERHDFYVDLGNGMIRPVRDVTDDPKNWHRAIGRKK